MPEEDSLETSRNAKSPIVPEKPAQVRGPGGKTDKPDEESGKEAVNHARRRLIWACMWGYLGVNFLMFLRYFYPRALFEPSTKVNIGYPSDFRMGVNQQFLESNRIWVRKDPGRIFVIKAVCTHLGCTPDWVPMQNIFHCPCHGSEYDIDGINFAGPAPRPMDRCALALQPDGTILVDTAQLFLDEPYAGVDQFDSPGAYIEV
ncbi:MAG: QcrA and Rieske domain-containing protein [Candidatus Acidiferrales bacterium]